MILFSLVSLASSRLVVPAVTSWLGELRTFHFAQFTFTGFSLLFLSSAAWVPWAFAGSAVWYPFIDSTPFVLIEQFLDDDEKIDDDTAKNGDMWGEVGEQKLVPDMELVDAEDTETTRGVLTALMNLTMLVAQVVVATTTGTLYILGRRQSVAKSVIAACLLSHTGRISSLCKGLVRFWEKIEYI
jgi:hypothetical protein